MPGSQNGCTPLRSDDDAGEAGAHHSTTPPDGGSLISFCTVGDPCGNGDTCTAEQDGAALSLSCCAGEYLSQCRDGGPLACPAELPSGACNPADWGATQCDYAPAGGGVMRCQCAVGDSSAWRCYVPPMTE
jgi:hypothetical protein